MSQIDREGTFLARIDDHGITETKNGVPQWCAQLYATHMFIEEPDCEAWGLTEPDWVDLDNYALPRDITSYQTMFSRAGDPTLGYDQVQAATGWDGASFADLDSMNLNGEIILIRTAFNEYEGKTRLQVGWIDSKDADPTRSLRKLDTAGLKDLDAKFAGKLNAGKKTAPASAKPVAAPKAEVKTKKSPEQSNKKAEAALAKKPSTPAKKPAAPAAPKKDSETPANAASELKMDKAEAWSKLCDASDGINDDVRNAAWLAGCEQVGGDPDAAGGRDEDDFTDEDWGRVYLFVCRRLNVIPF
jgi:hypothetical protein